MPKCKGCGAPIIWIRTPNGKAMPCDPQRIPYRTNLKGKYTLIDPAGRVCVGDLDLDSDKYGYISHFATCPAANQLRKIREDKQIRIVLEDD